MASDTAKAVNLSCSFLVCYSPHGKKKSQQQWGWETIKKTTFSVKSLTTIKGTRGIRFLSSTSFSSFFTIFFHQFGNEYPKNLSLLLFVFKTKNLVSKWLFWLSFTFIQSSSIIYIVPRQIKEWKNRHPPTWHFLIGWGHPAEQKRFWS